MVRPDAPDAGHQLLDEAVAYVRGWASTAIYADGTLRAPGCYGVPSVWPHIRQLLVEAGFSGPTRRETVLAARCAELTRGTPADTDDRTVGALGTRLDLVRSGTSLGYIEVGEIRPALMRSTVGVVWTDIGNLFPATDQALSDVMPALLLAAGEWLSLGGIECLIDYYAADVDPPEYLRILSNQGFTTLTTNERGWELLA